MDQGSNKNHSAAYNFTPTVTKFCVVWEGLSLPHDTKFGNCRCNIVDSRSFHSWSLIHGLRWSGLIKVGPGQQYAWYWLHTCNSSIVFNRESVIFVEFMNMYNIWVRSRNCDCLVTWFCYQLIAKPGNKTAAVWWYIYIYIYMYIY